MDNRHYERENICTLRLEVWGDSLVSYQMLKLSIVHSLLTLFVTPKVCYQVQVISIAIERMTYNERSMYLNGTNCRLFIMPQFQVCSTISWVTSLSS